MVVVILTGHAPVRGHLCTKALFDGGSNLQILQEGDKQCSTLSAAAVRHWHVSAITSLGTRLSNQKI
jgi:hypothetical protein